VTTLHHDGRHADVIDADLEHALRRLRPALAEASWEASRNRYHQTRSQRRRRKLMRSLRRLQREGWK
jgi:hypothetical protein